MRVSSTILNEKGQPEARVHIYNQATGKGTISDADGYFSIEVSHEENVLLISHLSYQNQQIKAKDLEDTIILIEDVNMLDPVVVSPNKPQPERPKNGVTTTPDKNKSLKIWGTALVVGSLALVAILLFYPPKK